MSTLEVDVYKGLFDGDLRLFFVPTNCMLLRKSASTCSKLVIKAFVLASQNGYVNVKFSYPEFDASTYPVFVENTDVRAVHSPPSFEQNTLKKHLDVFNMITTLKRVKSFRYVA